MWSNIAKWFTDRWPWYPVKRLLLDEEIPGGASYFFTLGTSIGVIFALQVISGIVQLFYYVPSADHAYNSVSYLRTQVPFGWLVHNMHYWGANAMVILVALHMIRVYVWAAYKNQLTWLIGVLLLLTTMALSFTGAPLIWDQAGYWAGEVGSGIASTVPFVGMLFKILLRGGESMGQLTLSRFFIFHVGILAPLLAGLIGMHVISFRTSGVVGPWNEEKRRVTGPFWPDQAYKDAVTASVIFFILIALCVFFPVSFSGPADPSNTSYLPKPEWNFLFIYQALKYFHGPWEPVGTVGVPFVLIALLVALPFLDRNRERNPRRRPLAMAALAIYVGFIVAFTIIGHLSPGRAIISVHAPKAAKTTPEKKTPEAQGVKKGEELFASQGCTGCHRVNGKGGTVGPDLSHEGTKGRSRTWLTHQIRDPKSHFPKSIMPSFTKLSDEQVSYLVDYLMSLGAGSSGSSSSKVDSPQRAGSSSPGGDPPAAASSPNGDDPNGQAHIRKLPGPAAYMIGNVGNGAVLFKQQCVSCHGNDGKGGVANPGSERGKVPPLNPLDDNLADAVPVTFAENIDRILQHGSKPKGPHPALSMPAWGDSHSLTQQEIANVEAYILQLNGVDRAKIMHPGIEPKHFLVLVIIVYILIILGIAVFRKRYVRGS